MIGFSTLELGLLRILRVVIETPNLDLAKSIEHIAPLTWEELSKISAI